MSDILQRLIGWYYGRCDGEWEHSWGVSIGTLDNPGWRVRIDLVDTPWESKEFAKSSRGLECEDPDDPDWWICEVRDGAFHAHCGPGHLGLCLRTFLDWSEAESGSEVPTVAVRFKGVHDDDFVREQLVRHWLSTTIWSRDVEFKADELPCFIADRMGVPVGHLTIAFSDGEAEVVTLAVCVDGQGIGTALLDAAVKEARSRGCRRIFLTTSNDNLRALAFYQKRGWRLVAVHRGMMDRYRKREPEIPVIGMNGIPLRDEIELELVLNGGVGDEWESPQRRRGR